MKRRISFLLAVLMCCGLLFPALAPTAAASDALNEFATAAKRSYENAVKTALAAGLEIDSDGYAHLPEELDEQADLEQLQALIGLIKASKAAWDEAVRQAEAEGVELVYDEDYEPARARVDEQTDSAQIEAEELELSDKIEWALRVKMTGTTDDTLLPVEIDLDAPTFEEIKAANPAPEHMTLAEYAAYTDSVNQKYFQARKAVYEPFVQNYLNMAEEQVEAPEYYYILATLSKTKIAALAKLDEVKSIEMSGFGTLVPVIPSAEPGEQVVPEKIDSRLQREMDAAEDDEIIRILLWLNAPTNAEIDATVPPPEDPSDPEQREAFILAAYRAREDTKLGIMESFVQNHMKGTNELLAPGTTKGPYLLIATTKSRILSFTALDEVKRIDQYGIPVFTADEDPPKVPTGEPEPPCEHDYQAVVTAPTCTEAGFTTYACANCGDEYIGDEVPALGHDFKDGVCTRCGAKDPDYEEPVVEPFRFDDVKDDKAFYYEPVYWAVEQKITKGTSEKLFSPDDGCTRAQVVTFLWRAAGEPEPDGTENPFKDVKESDYFYKAVLWAVEKGVTKGTSADKYSPEKTCTRGEIVTFLYRAEGAPEIAKKSKPFADVADGQYYADAVAWAVENGVTTGKSADTFAPDATCTRGEIVTFLFRAAKE